MNIQKVTVFTFIYFHFRRGEQLTTELLFIAFTWGCYCCNMNGRGQSDLKLRLLIYLKIIFMVDNSDE